MIDIVENIVKIGDRIIGKKIGNLTPSTVVAILTSHFYLNGVLRITNEYTFPSWDEKYPDWKDKLIVVGLFDEPQCPFSFQEVSNRILDNPKSFLNVLKEKTKLTNETINVILNVEYMGAEKSHTTAYPIDDVEVI